MVKYQRIAVDTRMLRRDVAIAFSGSYDRTAQERTLSSTIEAVSNPDPTTLKEEERQELEAVSAALKNSSRLLRLIAYIGDKYFRGETDSLREYDIATEVFGRSKDTFNGGEDAIVRVEASRLRKRLAEYYAAEGKDHSIHISIPPGSYVPLFTRQRSGPRKPEQKPVTVQPVRPRWVYVVTIAASVLTIFGGYLFLRPHRAKKVTVDAAHSSVQQTGLANPAVAYANVPLRILAGYDGKPQIDSAGNVWQPDEYFNYGGRWDRVDSSIARTSDPMLFKHWRNGNFSYDVPLRPGVYELHLYFLSSEPDSAGPFTFFVSANGKAILSSFDVNVDAQGQNIADERVFRDLSPAEDGMLHLEFTGGRASPSLNAIEILTGEPGRQLPVRIVMQPNSFTDHSGQFWHPDDDYMGGYVGAQRKTIAGTTDPELFAGERYGHFTYALPVDTRDRYTLVLHFAEFYFGPNASEDGGEGSRVFRVLCNGTTLLDNFDIYKEVGSLHSLSKTFYHLKPSPQGKLNITFEPIANNATVSGIEVLDESH